MTPRATLERLGVHHEGHELIAATITSPSGLRMRVLNLGGIVWSLHVPDAQGALADVVLGHDDPVAYLTDTCCLGAIAGRRGFARAIWDIAAFEAPAACGVVLTCTSPDGDKGIPGTLRTRATYTLTDDGAWEVAYHAEADRPTPVDLTQHCHFNLAGEGSAQDHLLRVDADGYLPLDAERIPKGTIAPVGGSPFDLRKARRLGDVAYVPGFGEGGLDHAFVLRSSFGAFKLMPAAELVDPASGRALTVTTTEPSVHACAGHHLRGVQGKSGRLHEACDAVCLETQHFPDSPDRPSFTGTIVHPGVPLRSRTRYAFSARPISARGRAG